MEFLSVVLLNAKQADVLKIRGLFDQAAPCILLDQLRLFFMCLYYDELAFFQCFHLFRSDAHFEVMQLHKLFRLIFGETLNC